MLWVDCISLNGMGNITNLDQKTNRKIVQASDFKMESQCFENVGIDKQSILIARSIVVKLLLSRYNSLEGITVCADMPFGMQNLLNYI